MFQVQALQSFSRLTRDYLGFLQYLNQTNGGLRRSICQSYEPSDNGNKSSSFFQADTGMNSSDLLKAPAAAFQIRKQFCEARRLLLNATGDYPGSGMLQRLLNWRCLNNSYATYKEILASPKDQQRGL